MDFPESLARGGFGFLVELAEDAVVGDGGDAGLEVEFLEDPDIRIRIVSKFGADELAVLKAGGT